MEGLPGRNCWELDPVPGPGFATRRIMTVRPALSPWSGCSFWRLAARRRPARRGSSPRRVRVRPRRGDGLADKPNAAGWAGPIQPSTAVCRLPRFMPTRWRRRPDGSRDSWRELPGAGGSTVGSWVQVAGVRGERGVRAGESRVRLDRVDGIVRDIAPTFSIPH